MSDLDLDKRTKALNCVVNQLKDRCKGIVLVGSLAYGNQDEVTSKSDIDLIVIYDDIKNCIDRYFRDEAEATHLRTNSYDGYLAKQNTIIDGDKIAVSLHNLNFNALQRISYGNRETLAYYRQNRKSVTYYSKDFDGKDYPFVTPARPIPGLNGERRIDSISMEFDGKYVLGNDMDKLLSGAKVLKDYDGQIKDCIDTLWDSYTLRLVEHCYKYNIPLKKEDRNIADLLVRRDRFSETTVQECYSKTQAGIEKALQIIHNYTTQKQLQPADIHTIFILSQKKFTKG